MSNRSALRKLAKKLPPPEELDGILRTLQEESDRSAAIVGAALVESSLERLLVVALQSREKTLPGKLFENRGPLSDFNSKILIAQAFGLIADPASEELQSIRHIRNVFAHARVPVTFETPELHKEVQAFKMLMAIKATEMDRPEQSARLTGELSSKGAFLLIVQFLIIILEGLAKGDTIQGWRPALLEKSR